MKNPVLYLLELVTEMHNLYFSTSCLYYVYSREHLGINPDDVIQPDITDPIIKSFLNGVWMRQASVNTKVYDEVFKCLPSDEVHSFQQLRVRVFF